MSRLNEAMQNNHRSLLSRIRNGLSGLFTRFGRRAASNSAKTSSATSMMMETSDNMECVLKQPSRGRGSSSATASAIKIKTSLASSEPNAHRTSRESPRPRRKATEEHTCPSPPSACVDDDDIGYQRFLDFLKTPSGSTPLQNLCGPSTNSTEGQEQPIEQSCPQGEGVSREEENSNAIEHLCRGEEEEDAASLSIYNFVELEETDSLPCAEKDALSSSKDVDSAMAWCALAAVLGCKAPSSVTMQVEGKIKQKKQLWEMEDTPCEDIPDLPFDDGSFFSVDPSTSEAPDLNEISFDESDDDEDSLFIVPDLDEVQDFSVEDTYHKKNVKEAADSTLTWSALALLLGAPAPASILKRSRKVSRVSDESASELVPSLH